MELDGLSVDYKNGVYHSLNTGIVSDLCLHNTQHCGAPIPVGGLWGTLRIFKFNNNISEAERQSREQHTHLREQSSLVLASLL